MNNICIGTAQFGMNYGIANQLGKITIRMARDIVEIAVSNDIWFYDTAQSYGISEEVLGQIFSDMKINGQVKCITKLRPNFTYKSFVNLRDAVQESSDKLNVDCLWGLLIHRHEISGDWNGFLKSIRELKDTGFINHFGVSVYEPEVAVKFAKEENIDIIQVPFNILDKRLLSNNFFEIARDNKKKIFVRSIFLQGLLLLDKIQLQDKHFEWAIEYIDIVRDFVQFHSLDLKSFLLNAVLSKVPYAYIMMGIDSVDQLIQNINNIKTGHIAKNTCNLWWSSLPNIPEGLLNPAKW